MAQTKFSETIVVGLGDIVRVWNEEVGSLSGIWVGVASADLGEQAVARARPPMARR